MKNKIFSVVMIVPFIAMFLQFNIEKTIQAVGYDYGYSLAGPKKQIYVLPNGDTVAPANGQIIIIKDIDSVLSCGPVMDMVFLVYPIDGVSGWERFKNGIRSNQPADKKVVVVIRKIDEFKKEQFIYAGLAAISSKKDYFCLMNEICQKVDLVLAKNNDFANWPAAIQNLYIERRGKPKLRVFLSYLAYRAAGGQDIELGYKVASISELNNLHLYTHNYLIDNKRTDIESDRICLLTSGGELFADAVIQEICTLPLSSEKKIAIIARLSADNALSYRGQIMDSESLTDALPEESEFINNYRQRCEFLSGGMYGFSVWLGVMASPISTQSQCENFYDIGKAIGAGLQVVNDVGDFSSLKKDALADFKMLKATAPIYYMLQGSGGVKTLLEKTPRELNRFMISCGAYEKSRDIAKQYRNIARRLIRQLPASEEKNYLLRSLSAIQTNRYLRDVRDM